MASTRSAWWERRRMNRLKVLRWGRVPKPQSVRKRGSSSSRRIRALVWGRFRTKDRHARGPEEGTHAFQRACTLAVGPGAHRHASWRKLRPTRRDSLVRWQMLGYNAASPLGKRPSLWLETARVCRPSGFAISCLYYTYLRTKVLVASVSSEFCPSL